MSISNRYRESGSSAVQRNAATIARAQSFRDNEQNKRREMLQKRIEETRKKLQEVSQSELFLSWQFSGSLIAKLFQDGVAFGIINFYSIPFQICHKVYASNISFALFTQIGYRSMIKGSQSISDLTSAIETPNNSIILEHSGTISAQGKDNFW